jgi:acyl-CoA thioesterase-1
VRSFYLEEVYLKDWRKAGEGRSEISGGCGEVALVEMEMDRMQRKLSTAALFFLIPCLCLAAACGPGKTEDASSVREAAPVPEAAAVANRTNHQVDRPSDRTAAGPLVIFLGDSLTAGLGLAEDQAYPARVAARLAGRGTAVRAINAGVSGDTTAGGLARLDWLLGQHPDIVVLGLGANDGLRGLPLAETEKNLREIIRRSRAAGARVLLLGMQIPPNYGPDYAGGFKAMFPRIAKELDVPLVPFLLEGVGGIANLNQADGMHPTAEGQEKVADTVTPYLAKLLAREGARAAK